MINHLFPHSGKYFVFVLVKDLIKIKAGEMAK